MLSLPPGTSHGAPLRSCGHRPWGTGSPAPASGLALRACGFLLSPLWLVLSAGPWEQAPNSHPLQPVSRGRGEEAPHPPRGCAPGPAGPHPPARRLPLPAGPPAILDHGCFLSISWDSGPPWSNQDLGKDDGDSGPKRERGSLETWPRLGAVLYLEGNLAPDRGGELSEGCSCPSFPGVTTYLCWGHRCGRSPPQPWAGSRVLPARAEGVPSRVFGAPDASSSPHLASSTVPLF